MAKGTDMKNLKLTTRKPLISNLGSYKVFWSIEVKENGEIKFQHHSSIEILKSRIKLKLGSKLYIITDKQFGLIINNYNGEEIEVQKPFTRKLVRREGNMIQVIPLTNKQFNSVIHA